MHSADVLLLGHQAPRHLPDLNLETNWLVKQITPQDLHDNENNTINKVLIVMSDSAFGTDPISSLFRKVHLLRQYSVRICIFCDTPDSIAGLENFFDDFIFLPCTPEEFQIRASLLCPRQATTGLGAGALLEEFANLDLKGNSPAFTDTLKTIKQVAGCEASVLIEGETGTGKENVARAIHYLSARRDKGFIPINCGAIPDSLFESELFGFEKGAFTDARQKQEGLVALANNGTLFLDEVDSLSLKAQAGLLRFLQTGEYRPLGSKTTLYSDVRVVAATNAHLSKLVQEGSIREDLYFRLKVLDIHMPPLRDRPQDIEIIANHLLLKYREKYGAGPKRIHPDSLLWLQQQSWPGNVRELENVLLRGFVLAKGSLLILGQNSSEKGVAAMTNEHCDPVTFQQAKAVAISDFEISYLRTMLSLTTGNVSKAARLAGKERRAFGKLVKKYNIDTDKFKQSPQAAL